MVLESHNDRASKEFCEKPYQTLFLNQEVTALHSFYCIIGGMSCWLEQAKRKLWMYFFEIHIESVAVLCVFPEC